MRLRSPSYCCVALACFLSWARSAEAQDLTMDAGFDMSGRIFIAVYNPGPGPVSLQTADVVFVDFDGRETLVSRSLSRPRSIAAGREKSVLLATPLGVVPESTQFILASVGDGVQTVAVCNYDNNVGVCIDRVPDESDQLKITLKNRTDSDIAVVKIKINKVGSATDDETKDVTVNLGPKGSATETHCETVTLDSSLDVGKSYVVTVEDPLGSKVGKGSVVMPALE